MCIGRHPNPSAAWYTGACSGHDEPELDPVSSLPGSAQDLTWTAILPKDGTVPVSAVGPTFWWGGAVSDPNPHALFGQAFLELQFYPDSVVKTCSSDGGYNVTYAPNEYTVCSPVWQVSTQSGAEDAAFNAELYDGSTNSPLIMYAGDTIKIHFFDTTPAVGWNIGVTDLTTGQSGSIVLASKYGPLLPLYSTQQIGNALGWGLVNDTPNAFVWEIGHTSNFTTPAGQLCVAGQTDCASYDTAHWLGFTPLKILSVTFANGSTPSQWAVVSDLGGTAEVAATCPSYGGPYCTYPWYAVNSAAHADHVRRRLPRHQIRLRPGLAVRHHAAMRRAVRTRLHLLRHGADALSLTPMTATTPSGPRPRRILRPGSRNLPKLRDTVVMSATHPVIAMFVDQRGPADGEFR